MASRMPRACLRGQRSVIGTQICFCTAAFRAPAYIPSSVRELGARWHTPPSMLMADIANQPGHPVLLRLQTKQDIQFQKAGHMESCGAGCILVDMRAPTCVPGAGHPIFCITAPLLFLQLGPGGTIKQS